MLQPSTDNMELKRSLILKSTPGTLLSPLTSNRILLSISFSLFTATANASVYKCVDAENQIHYQDKPCQESTSTELPASLASMAPKNQESPPFWKISNGTQIFYLLASVAYGSPDMYPLPKYITDKLTASSGLIVLPATDLGEAAAISQASLNSGVYKDSSTLPDHIKPETWSRTLELAKTLNIPEQKLLSQKPWMAGITLKNAALRQAGYDDKLSVDQVLIKASETRKPITTINSIENQVSEYDKLNDAESELILTESLYMADPKNAYFKDLVKAWKSGSEEALMDAEQAVQSLTQKNRKKSADDYANARIQAIADKMVELASDRQTLFLVVDSRILPGNRGILQKLDQKGFQSETIN